MLSMFTGPLHFLKISCWVIKIRWYKFDFNFLDEKPDDLLITSYQKYRLETVCVTCSAMTFIGKQ